MVTVGLLVGTEAMLEREADVESFLDGNRGSEPDTFEPHAP